MKPTITIKQVKLIAFEKPLSINNICCCSKDLITEEISSDDLIFGYCNHAFHKKCLENLFSKMGDAIICPECHISWRLK